MLICHTTALAERMLHSPFTDAPNASYLVLRTHAPRTVSTD
jgi:hypothetical protein